MKKAAEIAWGTSRSPRVLYMDAWLASLELSAAKYLEP